MKKGENTLFDVIVGSRDVISELVSIYLLGKLSNIIENKNIDLYRDDRLSVIEMEMGLNLII